MKTQFEERARDMLERMSILGSKQEEMLEAQGALGNELALVGGKVSAVSDQVGFSNHAILLLCGALSEMAKRVGISNGRYVKELEVLSRSVHQLPAAAGMSALPAGAAGLVSAREGVVMVTCSEWVAVLGVQHNNSSSGDRRKQTRFCCCRRWVGLQPWHVDACL